MSKIFHIFNSTLEYDDKEISAYAQNNHNTKLSSCLMWFLSTLKLVITSLSSIPTDTKFWCCDFQCLCQLPVTQLIANVYRPSISQWHTIAHIEFYVFQQHWLR